jgi:hypothetical protein
MKSLTRLQGCAPDDVMVTDLATVDLDIAALEHDYARPSGLGHPLNAVVIDARTGRRRQ